LDAEIFSRPRRCAAAFSFEIKLRFLTENTGFFAFSTAPAPHLRRISAAQEAHLRRNSAASGMCFEEGGPIGRLTPVAGLR
jgi:hypothetical protein